MWVDKTEFSNGFSQTTLYLSIGLSILLSISASAQPSDESANPRFQDLKAEVFKDEYDSLPQYTVKKSNFGSQGERSENKLYQAAIRTLNDSADLIEFSGAQKLLQANGICFSGRWKIDSDSKYSGLFSTHTDVPVIARASVALSGTKQKHKRAFGIAVKLIPDDLGQKASLNVFAMHSMGGTKIKHVLDLELSNAPPLGRLPNFRDIGTALRMKADLLRADEYQIEKTGIIQKPDFSYRTVAHLAKYGEEAGEINAPKWIRFTASTQQRNDREDFRDELRLADYAGGKIEYQIEVAKPASSIKKADWQRIGSLVLLDSVASKTCDQRLHFQHPL